MPGDIRVPRPGGGGGTALSAARLTLLRGLMVKANAIVPSAFSRKMIDLAKLNTVALPVKRGAVSFTINSPQDKHAASVLIIRIGQLINAEVKNIAYRVKYHEKEMQKIFLVGQEIGVFEGLPDDLKARLLDNVLLSRVSANASVQTEDKPKHTRADDDSEYYEIVSELKKYLLIILQKELNPEPPQ